jgi:proline racemase/trans-L-3-hydroxyproline dehydratase
MGAHIFAVDSHTMGEPTRVVVGGVPPVTGKTMEEKRAALASRFDHLRRALMHEPRGHRDMFGGILLDPADPEADLGVVFMDGGGYLTMCGHGVIGAVTVALETGIIKAVEPITEIRLDTPAGVVTVTADVTHGKVGEITFRNVPAFLYRDGFKLELPGIGDVNVAVAFGGNFFAMVDAGDLGLSLSPGNVGRILESGLMIREQVNSQLEVIHPLEPRIDSVQLVEFCGPAVDPNAHARNVVVFGRGQVDRSPCGTGTCARMAAMWARGELGLNENFIHESIIGTTFKGRVIETARVGDFEAVIPEISGRAFITGFQQFVIDPEDPLSDGFLIG